jgi:phosphoribosylanthranilate isomerase
MRDRGGGIQIKICGLTRVEEALECARLGADAIGFIFYPKSPRNLSEETAREISSVLPPGVRTVGVFVDERFSTIMHKVERCRLNGVQLHGREPVELIERLCRENLLVIKALFMDGDPSFEKISDYDASAYLVECGRGPLPGGNAMTWDWGAAKSLATDRPLILAGGLAPQNVSEAIAAGMPDAVDVSSGVEQSPGIKDLKKVAALIEAVSGAKIKKKIKRVF